MHIELQSLAGPDLAIAAAALVVAAISIVLTSLARRSARIAVLRCASLAAEMQELQRSLDPAATFAMHAERRIERLEAQQSRLTGRIGALESKGDGRSFDRAIDSARRGATVTNLTERFGLSRGEADLVARLHGRAGE
ncbi:MAG: DUF2802 domain-containing protein [Gammaproteobacteria bacterium]|nr:DUF2802 domain-containing protein [Gammaproteobacteria bacterium]